MIELDENYVDIFEEEEYIDITNVPKSFIYFLLDEGDTVLYVGKTTTGIQRIYAHEQAGIKEFSKVYCIPVEETKLDDAEQYYIKKYQPVYNTSGLPGKHRIKLNEIGKELKEEFPSIKRNFTTTDILQMIMRLHIPIYYVNDVPYIHAEYYFLLSDMFSGLMKGAPRDEVFYL